MQLILLLCLFLVTSTLSQTVFNEKNNITRIDPNFPFNGEMFTGFIVVDNTTQSNLYYHLYAFNASNVSKPAPVLLWLEGGPGCSSAFGNYAEFGPVTVTNGSKPSTFALGKNPYTWNDFAHLLYIDQPTGTGFSRANGLNVTLTTQASVHFQVFLARFYQLYPELADYPLYIVGESYAGKYIPVFVTDLLKNETFSKQIKIKAVAIGDGWSDPLRQVPTYGTFGYSSGIIDVRSRDDLRKEELQGVIDILNGNYFEATTISNGLLNELATLAGNISHWNYRDFDSSDSDFYSDWLNTTETQDFLNIPYEPYVDCKDDISDDFFNDNTRSVLDLYPELFSKLPVLLYQGQDDENVSYEGVVHYLNALNWTDVKEFRKAARVPWKLSNGTTGGLVKKYGNLTFLTIFKAGHLVPTDQPQTAYEMIYNFIHELSFD